MADPEAMLAASMPMYDWPEVQWAYDLLWEAIAQRLRCVGIAAPPSRTRTNDLHTVWGDPNLLLSQTCGYPYVSTLRHRVRLVATPEFDVAGCTVANYSSVIIAPLRQAATPLTGWGGGIAAINNADSQSGYWALRTSLALASAQAPSGLLITGSHRASLRAVAAGEADIAAIDAVCWAMALDHEPAARAAVTVLGWSPLAPGLPWITGMAQPPTVIAALQQAIGQAVAAPEMARMRAATHLRAAHPLPDHAYDRILALKAIAETLPFPAA